MDDITTLVDQGAEALERDSLKRNLEQMTERCKRLEAQIVTLQKVLRDQIGQPGQGPVAKVEITPEQLLCERQIRFLEEDGMSRVLDREETARLELLVRTLYLIKGKEKPATDTEANTLSASYTLAQLEQLAAAPDDGSQDFDIE